MDSFCIWPCSCFFHFIAFGLRLSGLGFEEFSLFSHLQLLFPFYCLRIKAVGFRLSWIFFWFLDLQLLFPFYCPRFKAVGFRFSWTFFVFRLAASFSIFLPLG